MIPQITRRAPGDTSLDADLKFTGRIYLYAPNEFGPEQVGELYKKYKENGLSLQYRGYQYLIRHMDEEYRTHTERVLQFKKGNPAFASE